MKADRAGHIILEIAAGLRDEQYLGEAQETLAALMEEYNVAWQLSPPGNQRDILDLERTLFSEDWSGLPAQIQKAMQPGGCSQMNWTDVFIGPFGWAEQVSEKSRETLACDPMAISPSITRPFQLIYSGDPEAALDAVEEAENKGMSHPWLEDGRYIALLAAGRVNDPAVHGPGAKGGNMTYDRQILREALAGDPAVARQMAFIDWIFGTAYYPDDRLPTKYGCDDPVPDSYTETLLYPVKRLIHMADGTLQETAEPEIWSVRH